MSKVKPQLCLVPSNVYSFLMWSIECLAILRKTFDLCVNVCYSRWVCSLVFQEYMKVECSNEPFICRYCVIL